MLIDVLYSVSMVVWGAVLFYLYIFYVFIVLTEPNLNTEQLNCT